MSYEFTVYTLLVTTATAFACCVIGWRALFEPSRLIGWYMVVLLLTYLIRPAGTNILGDRFLLDWLGVDVFERNWLKMSVAVCSAIVCVSFGHRAATKGSGNCIAATLYGNRSSNGVWQRLLLFAGALIVWGYVSMLITQVTGARGGNSDESLYGVAEQGTFWLMDSNLFVSTGCVLLYISTGRLNLSLLLSLPWLIGLIQNGYGRINVIGFFFALLAVWLFSARARVERFRVSSAQVVVLVLALCVVLLVFFPGAKMRRGYFSEGVGTEEVTAAWHSNFDPRTWFASTSDLAGFETTLYHLQDPSRVVFGTYYVYFYLLKPVPRVLWTGKPYPSTLAEEWFGVEMDRRYFGWAPGSIGMAFQQWGWVGIPLEFLFTGWLLGWLEVRLRRGNVPPHALLVYAGFFSLLPQLGRDSLLLMIADRWLFVYGLPAFVLWRLHTFAMKVPARQRSFQGTVTK